ncbi:hypothetical protein ND861_01070 [Leptospira sp. 2 VSF19]|uniref:Glycosyltransferase RgtA/B/C/D-like domain-containing protein n=1 Tax=Leptospira soteropolitanensis TaxID=2950025 RepID=A0AAW5VGT7_9LEPT|nr:hypothetical protein [Leptospira soteropolitanensis]MCW7491235.1 hypothetical protein [Leptospira soteropolitanensis]MCW7498820.1 hypothetical protein [Leptospira soteropolitanensis]MCW7521588.1 hypothetical protein [Leptospira soteropolitanensis]MCW7524923.1 hypothetical protein [Leptospira soteropolitanensis]MCW7528791.1 hypothetical protein [Leptospira soteropolitanensis]
MKLRNLKPILILLILFSTFHLFYDAIYENHLGEGTDSDILYPYLFARDFWTSGWAGVRGWNLPPCSYLFPEIVLAIVFYPVLKSVYWFHFAFGFLSFVMPFYLAKALGIPKKKSYLFSLGFLALAGTYPNDLGQFYFPAFHAMIFFFASYTLWEINHWEQTNRVQTVRFLFVISLIWISEYWFFVHITPFLLVYAVVNLQKKSIFPVGLVILGFGLGKVWQWGLRHFGIGIVTSKDLPTMDRIQSAGIWMFKDIGSWFSGLTESVTKHPVFADWFYWYFVLLGIYIFTLFFRFEGKKSFLEIVFLLSPFLSIVALFVFQIEPNFRYLFFLPFCLLLILLRWFDFFHLLRSISTFVLFLGIVFFYYEKYPNLIKDIQTGELKRTEKLECLSKFHEEIPGAATYWPIKYIYAFSNKSWTLVPFTKDGIYYPWISNKSWDKGFGEKPFETFIWGVTESKENLIHWKGVRLVGECAGWFFYER